MNVGETNGQSYFKKIRNLVLSEVRIQHIQNDLQIYRQMFRLKMKRSSTFIKIFSEYGNLSFTSQCVQNVAK